MPAPKTEAPPIDADAVDITDTPEPAVPAPSMELATMGGTAAGIIRAESPADILSKATQIADALKGLIDSQGLAVSVGGKKKHVEVGAWQACGTMLGALGGQALHAETVWTRPVLGDDGITPRRTRYTAEVKRYKWVSGKKQLDSVTTYDVDGMDWEACVEVRTADGTVHGRAEAMVSRSEETWSRREDFALRSMAETRAESRAYRRAIGWIVHLAGYSPTPAEEMGHTSGADTSAPAALAPVPDGQKAAVFAAIALLCSPTMDAASNAHAKEVAQNIMGIFDGILPQKMGLALMGVAGRKQRLASEAATAPAASDVPVDVEPPAAPPAERPPAGSVPMPDLSKAQSEAEAIETLLAAGCICAEPLNARTFDAACPLADHAVPF